MSARNVFVPADDYERVLTALDAALNGQIGDERLIDVMQRRYGREVRQWQANHDERKQERDAARAERDAARVDVDALIKRLADAEDARLVHRVEALTAALVRLVRRVERAGGYATPDEQADLWEARAALAEQT